MPQQTALPHRFAALDSWRGICALSVVLFHLNAGTHLHALLNNGYVAVDFFFVLSGFVIGSAYHDRIRDGADLARFSLRRVGRLYPLHLAVLLVYLALETGRLALHNPAAFTGERSWPAFFADLFLLQGFNAYDLSWNMPAWSISIELWTNLAFAVLALALGRRLPWLAAGLAAVMTVLLALTPPVPTPFSAREIDILNGAFQCVMEFFLGVAGFSLFAWARGRPDYDLPGDQDQLIEAIAKNNPNTIVVLNNAQPIALPWLNKVKAVLEMWYPGDAGGVATANILLGRNNPAGRLPFTWAEQLDRYVSHDPAHPERHSDGIGGKTTFSEGILVGYRWFDAQKIKPLFPFGYGLSYTKFVYSQLTTSRAQDGGADLSFKIQNAGSVDGDEVPQVYVDAPEQRPGNAAQFAVRALAAFDRIHLKTGESRNVTVHIAPRAFEYWSTSSKGWMTAGGPRKIHVGASSRDLRLDSELEVR